MHVLRNFIVFLGHGFTCHLLTTILCLVQLVHRFAVVEK